MRRDKRAYRTHHAALAVTCKGRPGLPPGRPFGPVGHSSHQATQLQILLANDVYSDATRTSAKLAAGRRCGRRRWARRHAGGRGATAAARARRRFVILEVRRALELILGPTHF